MIDRTYFTAEARVAPEHRFPDRLPQPFFIAREALGMHMKTKNRNRSGEDWRSIENEKEKYAAYLCSREWSEKKEAVKKRSGGTCERCNILPGEAVHHLNYERKYNELLEDLEHNCKPCHEFTHAKSGFDPRSHKRLLDYLIYAKTHDKRPIPIEVIYELSVPSDCIKTCVAARDAIDNMAATVAAFGGDGLCIGTLLQLEDAIDEIAGFRFPHDHLKKLINHRIAPEHYETACKIVGVQAWAIPSDLQPPEDDD